MQSIKRLILLGLVLSAVLALPTVRGTDLEQKEFIEDFGETDNYAEYEGDDESEIELPLKQVYSPPGPQPVHPVEYPYLPPPAYPPVQEYGPVEYGPPPPPPPPPVYQPLPAPPPSYPSEPVYQEYGPPLPPLPAPTPYYPSQKYEAPIYELPPPPPKYEMPPPPPPKYEMPPPPPPKYEQPSVYVPEYQNYSVPVVTNYVQQNYSAPVQVNNYSVPMQQSYVPPKPIITYIQKPTNYTPVAPIPVYNGLSKSYSVQDLAPFIPLASYRANHWSLFYYRSSPYRICPKNVYLSAPSYKDIEAAFAFAQQQLNGYRGSAIQYINSTAPSYVARHQVFSFISQLNNRMDEEGLLVELVSSYIADRACLTKWDKQRYLPQLTKLVSVSNFPGTHSCSNYYRNQWQGSLKYCVNSRYRTIDGFCNNPVHPYWGKSNVCHIRLLSPDYADGISVPRNSYNPRFPLPNPRLISNYIHNDIPLESPYNLMKMQWGQFINHDITNTALSSYDGLVDCCKNPGVRGCYPILVPPGDKFYAGYNVTCLNFIRSGVCPLCQLGPRQQLNKNTAFIDLSHIYGNTQEQAQQLRTFRGGLLRTSSGKNNEVLLPIANSRGQEQCSGSCFLAGDTRVNQHPGLTALHLLMLRNHNIHAVNLALRHPTYNDETLFQEARRLNIAEYQMITYNEYLPIVFGPILSAYYHLIPQQNGYTYYNYKVDPTTWNEYSTASCRFGHSQIQSVFGLYSKLVAYGQQDLKQPTFRLKDWFLRPSLLNDGLLVQIINGLLARQSQAVDPWISNDVRNHLYQSHKEVSGGDLAATNIQRGRDHGIPGYVHYVEYCFNIKVRGWKDLSLFIPQFSLNQLRKLYRVVENVDLFTGGLAERHFPGADIGPTFACINGIQYYHLKHGDRYYFEHGGQAGSFTPDQLQEIRRTTLARLLCRTSYLKVVPAYAFLQPSNFNPIVDCSTVGEINYSKF